MSYVAKNDLYIGGTKARNAGTVVTEEELERFPEWKEQVERKSAKLEEKKRDEAKKPEEK